MERDIQRLTAITERFSKIALNLSFAEDITLTILLH